MTLLEPAAATAADPPFLSKASVLWILIRRSGGHVAEATLIPSALFYVWLTAVGTTAAFIAALVWSYGAVLRRLAWRRPVPTILLLGLLGLTVRTVIAIANDSAFIYFLQPVLGTMVMAMVFLGSILVGRPLIARLANDFWPLEPEVMGRPRVTSLFRRLTVLWAVVNVLSAAATLTLLLCLPLATFVAVKQFASMSITVAGIALTIDLSVRTARREGLIAHTARRPGSPGSDELGAPRAMLADAAVGP